MSENKREHVRKDCLIPVRFTYDGELTTFYARLINYGDGGICLTTRTPVRSGAQLELSLEAYTPEAEKLIPYQRYPVAVRWSKEIPERRMSVYETGLQYVG